MYDHSCLWTLQTKTALSRMSRERENVGAQLTQAEQMKLVAESELVEVRCKTFLATIADHIRCLMHSVVYTLSILPSTSCCSSCKILAYVVIDT